MTNQEAIETIKAHYPDERYTMLREALDMAMDALKSQESIAPKLIKMYPHDIYECGNCGHKSVGSKDYKAKYCPECGRELKWE